MAVAWQESTVWEAFCRGAEKSRDRTAVSVDGLSITYGDLQDLATRASVGLLELGVRRGDKVALWLPNGLPFLIAALGLVRIGAVLVAVNPRFRPAEVSYVLQQSDSVALIMQPGTGSTDQVDVLSQIAPELAQARAGRLEAGAFPQLKHVILVGGEDERFFRWHDLQRAETTAEQQATLRAAEAAVRPDDVAVFQYTSGSTAFPKAVMLGHNTIARNGWHFGEALALTADDTYMVPLPFFHVGGLVTGAICAFVHGAGMVTMAQYEPEEFLRLCQDQRCTVLSGVETTYVMAMAHPSFASYDLRCADRCICLGTTELIRRVHDVMGIQHISTLYGISEAGPCVSIVRVGEPFERSLYTAGRPQPDVQVGIFDPDTGSQLKRGERGEICVRGWNLMQGYYKQPEETAEAIDPQGWLHTGDAGTLDQDGFLTFMGRIKNVIRVGGENVSAEQVEDRLTAHEAVKIAQVVASPDARLTEVCVAYVELKDGMLATEDELIQFCRATLAGFKVPRKIRFTSEWPMTGSGKIQRAKLRDREFGQVAETATA